MSSTEVRTQWTCRVLVAAAIFVNLPGVQQAQAQNPGFAKEPVIVEYDVDPTWPKYPENISSKGWTSGIAIDSKEQIWFFKKGEDPVQVYTTDGTFVRTWGQGMFSNPHHIRIDQWTNLIMPWGLSINAKDEVWVCGSSPHWWLRNGRYPEYKDQIFMRFDTDGRVQQVWTIPLGDIGEDKNNPDTSKLAPGEAVGVHCIVQDSKGNLYVGDIYGERAQKFVPVTSRPEQAAE